MKNFIEKLAISMQAYPGLYMLIALLTLANFVMAVLNV